jgi:hypothetical protein
MTRKPILLICGCRKYEEYLHAAIRRMTRPEWEIVGVIGGGQGEPAFNPRTHILTLPVPDTYEALPTKIHAAFTWIWTTKPGIPGIFKTDDDLVYNVDALVRAVLANTATPYWGIKAVACHTAPIIASRIADRFDDKTLTPTHQTAVYCIGHGYWLSATALEHALAARNDYITSYLEDVCTGFVMNRAGWKPVRIRIPAEEHPRTPQLLALK